MTDEEAGTKPMSLRDRITNVRLILASREADYAATKSFASRLAASSMRQHLEDLESQAAALKDAELNAGIAREWTPGTKAAFDRVAKERDEARAMVNRMFAAVLRLPEVVTLKLVDPAQGTEVIVEATLDKFARLTGESAA